MYKIKKLTMENFGVFKKKQEIEFSTDEQRNTTVIFSENVGKTTLVNAIKNAVGFEIRPTDKNYQNYDNSKSHVIFEDEAEIQKKLEKMLDAKNEKLGKMMEKARTLRRKDYGIERVAREVISRTSLLRDDTVLCFVDSEEILSLHRDNLEERFDLRPVVDVMNELLYKFRHGRLFQEGIHFLFENGKIIAVNNQAFEPAFARTQQTLANCLLLLAIRKIYFPNTFLVCDDPFHNMHKDSRMLLLHLLLDNVSQLIFVISSTTWLSILDSREKSLPSLREIVVEKQRLGKEYRISYNPADGSTEVSENV